MFGTGASLCYTPSLAILGHYFRRHLGLVNGVVAFGSSIFTMVMPHILKGLLEPLGLPNTLLFLAGMTFVLVIVTLSFKELMPKKVDMAACGLEQNKKWWTKIINVDNWRNRKYVVWALVVPLALFGYFVPYVHIVEHVKKELPGEDGALLITCIAITSAVGRIVFGKIVDLPKVNGIILQQVIFLMHVHHCMYSECN